MSTIIQRKPILTVRRALILAICLVSAHRFLMVLTESDQTLRSGISDIFTTIVNLSIAVGMFNVARKLTEEGRHVRLAWSLIASGLLSATLGTIIFFILNDMLGQNQFPSIGDVFYMTFYPLFGTGLMLMPGPSISKEERTKVLLDTAIVMIAAFLVIWIVLIAPILKIEQTEEPLAILVAVAYPILDWAMVFATLRILFSRTSQVHPTLLLLLALASCGQIVYDVVVYPQLLANTFISGNWIDTLFIANLCLLIVAMAVQLAPRSTDSPGRAQSPSEPNLQFGWTVYIPYLWVAVAYLLLTQSRDNAFPVPFEVLAWTVGGIIGLVVVRQIVAFQENARLSRQLAAELVERKAAEQAVRQLNEELEQRVMDRTAALRQEISVRERLMVELERKNKELESIVYISSHDLRSPLVNIQGFGKNLQKYFGQVLHAQETASTLEELRSTTQPVLSERIPKALRFIETSSAKMGVLIDGLLRLSRIGRAPLQMRPVDMNLLIQSILETMTFQNEKANAQIKVQQPLAACCGDQNQLNQVFSNLLDNALKYRAPDRALTINVSSQIEAEKVIYTIADTGVGIVPENREKIWEIFRRCNDNDAVLGEGLGLTIARRIVERHGGRIWVESELGIGSQFYVELPAQDGIHA